MSVDVAYFWTITDNETESVKSFARIPKEYEDRLDEHPLDEEIFYWCDDEEWLMLGAGEVLGDVKVLRCACDDCGEEYDDESV